MEDNTGSMQSGLSIMNPAFGSIHVGSILNTQEEEEDAKERELRNAELNKELQDVFDDIDTHDINDTINNSTSYRTSNLSHVSGDHKYNYIHNDYLRNTEEIYNNTILKEQLEKAQQTYEAERQEFHREIHNLQKKVSIAEAESSRYRLTVETTKQLLVESKTEIAKLVDDNTKLSIENTDLLGQNTKLATDLDHTKILLNTSNEKFVMLQKNSNIDRRNEAKLDKTNEKNSAKIALMQNQIDNTQIKLSKINHEYENLQNRFMNLERSRDSILQEKNEIIGDLERKLRETQHEYHKLLGSDYLREDNIKLQRLVTGLQEQSEDMQKTITRLTDKLDATNAELNSVNSLINCNGDSEYLNESPTTPKRGASPDLKSELFKAFSKHKSYREEISSLKNQMAIRDNELKQLKNDENDALMKMNKYREDYARLVSKCNITESQLNAIKIRYNHKDEDNDEQLDEIKNLKSDNDEYKSRINFLETEYDELKQKLEVDLEKQKFLLKDSQAECERLNKLYSELLTFKDNLIRQTDEKIKNQMDKIIKLENQIVSITETHAEAVKEMNRNFEKEKMDFIENNRFISNDCTNCRHYLNELNEIKLSKLDLEKTITEYSREMDGIRNDLVAAEKSIQDLNIKLGLKEENDQLIGELKAKALEFQEFMKNHSNTSLKDVSTSPQRIESKSQSSCTSPDFQEKSDRELERRVKEEMSRAYAAQIRVLEDKFKNELLKFQENIKLLKQESDNKHNEMDRLNQILEEKSKELENLQAELDKCLMELHIRNKEVELLKYAIISERSKTTELAMQKEAETKQIFDNQNDMLKKCRDELEMCQNKMKLLKEDLKDHHELMNNERNSMKLVLKQIAEERKKVRERENELINKISELHEEHNKEVDKLREKYISAKKTAANYKQYSEDKERHMMSEYDRLKDGYTEAVNKVHLKLKHVMEDQEKILNEKIRKIERDYYLKTLNLEKKQYPS